MSHLEDKEPAVHLEIIFVLPYQVVWKLKSRKFVSRVQHLMCVHLQATLDIQRHTFNTILTDSMRFIILCVYMNCTAVPPPYS